jgi:nucleotide-binding universal stress UspA family protein
MVRLGLGQPNAGLLNVAGGLADRLHAGIIGIAVAQPLSIVYGDGYVSGEVIDQDHEALAKEITEAEAEFRSVLQNRVGSLEWRSEISLLSSSGYLARQARCADFLITGVDRSGGLFNFPRSVDVGDLIMQAGRPVLIVPDSVTKCAFERAVVGWKDTRESRRAVLDALPLLQRAPHVAIVEIADEQELPAADVRLKDVAAWLKRNDVEAETVTVTASGDDAAQLKAIAEGQRADFIVAGAYGHSRLREWALGGVTRDLLLHADRCSFVSH